MNDLIITQPLKEFKNVIEEIIIKEKKLGDLGIDKKNCFVNQLVSEIGAESWPIRA